MVEIKPQRRVNPQDMEAQEKYYARAVSTGTTNLDRLAYLIANQSTVRKADCLAVLEALQHNIADELSQGRIVQLGSFGNFQIGVRSEGVETPDLVSTSSIKQARLHFRPGTEFRNLLKTVRFKKAS